jgi:hypothetical protein
MMKYEYTGASHSFDGETAGGADGDASKLARNKKHCFLKTIPVQLTSLIPCFISVSRKIKILS